MTRLAALLLLSSCAISHETASHSDALAVIAEPPATLLFFPVSQGEWLGDQAGQTFELPVESEAGVRYTLAEPTARLVGGINLNFARQFEPGDCEPLTATSADCAGERVECPATATLTVPAGYTDNVVEWVIGIGEPPGYRPVVPEHVFAVTRMAWMNGGAWPYCVFGGADAAVMMERAP